MESNKLRYIEFKPMNKEALTQLTATYMKDCQLDHDHNMACLLHGAPTLELNETIIKRNTHSNNYNDVFSNMPEACFIVNGNGIILDINPLGSEMLSAGRDQLIHKPFLSYLSYEPMLEDFYSLRSNSNTRNIKQIECELNREDKTSFYALVKNTPVFNEISGEFNYFLTTVTDISKWREQERKIDLAFFKERELNVMKSRFITMASHEFRTPLASILLSTELIEKYKNELGEENRTKHLSTIKSSVQKLSDILHDFLSTSKIENGEIKNNPELFDMDELIADLICEVGAGSHHNKILFAKKNPGIEVNLDGKLLKICLHKLIENAIKYSLKNEAIQIEVEYNHSKTVVISIKDNGIGIPFRDQRNIFSPFFKGENAENIEGNGLGLYDVKKIVTLMGGKIHFDSVENNGTTFKLEFELT